MLPNIFCRWEIWKILPPLYQKWFEGGGGEGGGKKGEVAIGGRRVGGRGGEPSITQTVLVCSMIAGLFNHFSVGGGRGGEREVGERELRGERERRGGWRGEEKWEKRRRERETETETDSQTDREWVLPKIYIKNTYKAMYFLNFTTVLCRISRIWEKQVLRSVKWNLKSWQTGWPTSQPTEAEGMREFPLPNRW